MNKKSNSSSPPSSEAMLTHMRAVRETLLQAAQEPPSNNSNEWLTEQIQEWIEMVKALDRQYVAHIQQEKADFVSYVAHELRTPITSIRGYADMLAGGMMGPVAPEQVAFLQTIIRNAERLQILIADLQDFTKIEAHRLQLERKPTLITEVIQSALRTLQKQVAERDHQVIVDVADDLPSTMTDPNRLRQIVTELVRNASKYTPSGGEIHIRAWQEDEHIHCAIRDTGIGISPEDQAALFTPFFRSESPAVREMPGTGLGLYIVKYLVERHGGTLTLESQVGQGTTVTFRLPIVPPELIT